MQSTIARLGATEVVYVSSTGAGPALATRALTGPVDIVHYLAKRGVTMDYFAATNPRDLSLVSGAKLSLTAPLIAARRAGIVVPITTYAPVPNATELFHYAGYPAISAELQQLYQVVGRYPSYLALVGNATSIPLSYTAPNTAAGDYGAAPTDLDYANADGDRFADIAVGRVMAYNVFDAALLTTRISTYEQLFDGVWERTMVDVGGQWNAAYLAALLGNCGFGYTSMIGATGDGQPVEAGFIAHNDHSDYHHIGGAFDVNSQNVLAPAFIASEGCATAAIDFESLSEDGGGVVSDRGRGMLAVNRLFRLGAVAYLGSTRSETGAGQMVRSRAVNAMLAGEPLGRCYMAGMDVFSVDGLVDNQRRNRILLGDPALRVHVPSAPVVAPATHVVTSVDPLTDVVEVSIPSTLLTSEVDRTWCVHWGLTYPQYWGERPGLYGMDVDRFCQVRLTPRRRVSSVEELDVWPTVSCWTWGNVKLGLMGSPTVDHRQDGTDQLVWALRANIMDWSGAGGGKVPLAQMSSARFRIRYSSGKEITSCDARQPGSSVSVRAASDSSGAVIVYVPPETTDAQIAALAPIYTLDAGATCDQPSGAIPDPPLSTEAPARYVVTPQSADDLPAKVYSVIVTRDAPPFTYSRWTGDADSGLSDAHRYTAAVNLGGAAVTVNGVAFQASALEGEGFSIRGGSSWVSGGAPDVAGDGKALASDFLYGGTPLVVTLSGLTPGAKYEAALFSYGWEDAGRTAVLASGGDSRVLDQDAFGAGEGIRILYTFAADRSGRQEITIGPAGGSAGTFHLCALANRLVGPPAGGVDE